MIRFVLCVIAALTIAAAKPPPTPVFATPTTIRWGNYVWPSWPALPPKFVEWDLAGRSPLFVDWQRSVKTNAAGNYQFNAHHGTRQVLWLADSVIKKGQTIGSSGFPVALFPEQDQPWQNLTIMGVPGKVYVTAWVNNGRYTMNVR